jgi:O-antigen ligase
LIYGGAIRRGTHWTDSHVGNLRRKAWWSGQNHNHRRRRRRGCLCFRERRQRDAGHRQNDRACDDRRVNLAPAGRTSISRFHQILTRSTNRDRDSSKIGRDRHSAGAAATGGALAITVGLTVFSGSGFSDASQATFIALAGVTLLLTASFNGSATIAALRSPPALTLGALGALCIVSAAWTIGAPVTSARWGLTIMSYGAVFVAAATFTRVLGPWPLAAGIAVLAAIEAVLGVHALAMHALPDAELIGGVWRPGGTFEYPPALAILEVGAIPILSYAMARESKLVTAASAAATLLAGAVLGLAGSRLAVGLAVVFLAILVLSPRASGISRITVASTAALLIVGALAGSALLNGHLVPDATPTSHASPNAQHISEVQRTSTIRPRSDLLHGRAHEWDAALRTWLDRPLLGAGAGSYYEASLPYQGSAPTLYAHDLPLELAAELGVLGLLMGVALYVACGWTIATASDGTALILLGATVVAFMASNLVDWTWHLAGLGAVWAACAGGLAGCGLQIARRA